MEKSLFPFSTKRTALSGLALAFIGVGTYNSVVVNSDSFMDEGSVRFVKRLDEVYGVHTKGRLLASQATWTKLAPPKPASMPATVPLPPREEKVADTAEADAPDAGAAPHAAIKEELNLELVGVFNAKQFPQPPAAGTFSGSLTAEDGVIKSISANFPGGGTFSIADEASLTGNVFQYEMGGQECSGMMYQKDKSSYMVTLTNCALEGTRLEFAAAAQEVERDLGNNAEIAMNGPESVQLQAETQADAPAFQPVTNDDGTQAEVAQFGDAEQPQAQALEMAQNGEVAQPPAGGIGFSFTPPTEI